MVIVVLKQVVFTVIKLSSFELALVILNFSSCGDMSRWSLILGLIDLNIAFVLVISVLVIIISAIIHEFPQILKLIVPFGHSYLTDVLTRRWITPLTIDLPSRLSHLPFELALSFRFPLRSRPTSYSVSDALQVVIDFIRLLLTLDDISLKLLKRWFSMLRHRNLDFFGICTVSLFYECCIRLSREEWLAILTFVLTFEPLC